MLRRKFYQKMLDWKNTDCGSTALLVTGARRVGKSTLVEEFARNEYKSYILIDFSQASKDALRLFEEYRSDLNTFFTYICALYGVKLYNRESVMVFDEVQFFPQAREFIKQLVADGRYDYIETGSLLSIKHNVETIVIPSEEQEERMYPLDFEEFLWACGEENLSTVIKSSFDELNPLPDALHKKAMRLFREYMLVGGMPQSVNEYVSSRDFARVDRVKRRILSLYRQDAAKFAKGYEMKVMAVFDGIPAQLSRHEKRYRIASLGKNARMRDYKDAFFWLSDASITNNCYKSTDPNVGLNFNANDALVKCYMADTGLLASMILSDSSIASNDLYKEILFGKISINEGMLVENVVAQQLIASGHRLFFYSNRDKENSENTMEIDFLISKAFLDSASKMRISPIEVKSANVFKTVSLDKFKAKFSKRIGTSYVFAPKQLSVRKDLNCVILPLYMCGLV